MIENSEKSFEFETLASLILGFGLLMSIPAIYGILSTAYHAAVDGTVMVFSVGLYETARAIVPWPQAWARFLGFTMLVLCPVAWLASTPHHRLWWLAVALAALGLIFVMFSLWFSTWRGTLAFTCISTWIIMTYAIDHKYGRTAATVIIISTVATLVYIYSTLQIK